MNTIDNLAILEEYRRVLQMKKLYEELLESFKAIIEDLFDYAKNNGIDLPNRPRIYRNLEKTRELVEYGISMSENIIGKSDNDKYQ